MDLPIYLHFAAGFGQYPHTHTGTVSDASDGISTSFVLFSTSLTTKT